MLGADRHRKVKGAAKLLEEREKEVAVEEWHPLAKIQSPPVLQTRREKEGGQA